MTYRKMTEGDVRDITKFIEACVEGTGNLTWRDVEEKSNFTRQALQAHAVIKAAYLSAKQKISESRKPKKAEEKILSLAAPDVAEELVRLRKKIEVLEHRETIWKRRWYCIAYHIRQQGLQMHNFDKPVPIGQPALTEKQVSSTLESFNQDIPPVARRRDY